VTDAKTDPPKGEFAAILERLDGLERGQKIGFALLDSQLMGFGDLKTTVATVKDEQASFGRKLGWFKKAVSDFVQDWETFKREYVLFQNHVFSQFDRTSVRPLDDDAPAPNGNNGNGNGHDPDAE
jgi:hypothetical protein